MTWLGVHFPALALEVFHPREAARPRVVVENNRVVLRNRAAVEAGIAAGCSLATAHSIVSGLEHHQREPEREARRLKELGEILYRFSAQVSPAPPADLILEADGSRRLFGDVTVLARQVSALCDSLGHEAHCRWAKTPMAAQLLARSGSTEIDDVPLSCMDLDAAQIERFANMGIHHLGQLLALPRRSLARRAGQSLVNRLQQITGALPDPRSGLQPAQRFRHSLHLLEPINSKEALRFPMQRLLTELHHWLVGRQLGSELLLWHFAPSGRDPDRWLRLPVRFARPQQHQQAFLGITHLQLDQTALPADVMSIVLEARRLRPWSSDSRELFQQLPGEAGGNRRSRELEDLVDELRARLGQGACCSIDALDQHCPEDAWARAALTGRRRAADSVPSLDDATQPSSEGPASERPSPARPLWLFEPPRPTKPEKLTLLRGPERIHTGWWRESRRRDYYVARHESGAECWAFVDAQDRWYLHGYFS